MARKGLSDIVNVVNQSSYVNSAQLVGTLEHLNYCAEISKNETCPLPDIPRPNTPCQTPEPQSPPPPTPEQCSTRPQTFTVQLSRSSSKSSKNVENAVKWATTGGHVNNNNKLFKTALLKATTYTPNTIKSTKNMIVLWCL